MTSEGSDEGLAAERIITREEKRRTRETFCKGTRQHCLPTAHGSHAQGTRECLPDTFVLSDWDPKQEV